MIIILHGDNIEASRQELNQLKLQAKGKEIRQLEGKGLDATMLTQALESSSLFGGDTLVVIEHLFTSLGKKISQIKEAATKIASTSADVIIWEEKEVGKTVLDNVGKNVNIRLFKTPVIIFKFLDAIKPNNANVLLSFYQQAVSIDAPELIFTMMVRRIRQLLMLAGGATPDGLQGWQAKGLTNQARFFTMNKLLGMHKKLLDMEYSLKTGSSPFTLRQLIEQFLIEL